MVSSLALRLSFPQKYGCFRLLIQEFSVDVLLVGSLISVLPWSTVLFLHSLSSSCSRSHSGAEYISPHDHTVLGFQDLIGHDQFGDDEQLNQA